MNVAKKTMIDIIYRMSDEKVMKLLPFAKFIESENGYESELLISDEEESEILRLLENDERMDGNIVLNSILRVQEWNLLFLKQLKNH